MKKLMLLIGAAVGLLASTWAEIKDTDVAAIGDTGYATLQAAVDAANGGATVKFLTDITTTSKISVDTADKNFVLDLDGHFWDSAHSGWIIDIGRNKAGETVVISNGGIHAHSTSAYNDALGIRVDRGSTVTLANLCVTSHHEQVVQVSGYGASRLNLQNAHLVMLDSRTTLEDGGIPALLSIGKDEVVTIDKDSSVICEGSGQALIQTYGTIHVYGTVHNTTMQPNRIAILGNCGQNALGKNGLDKIYIYDGATVISDNGKAVQTGYGAGTLQIGAATIQGTVGVDVQCTNSGTVSINDGVKVTGTTGAAVTSTTKTGFITGGEFKGKNAMPTSYIKPAEAGYEARWLPAATEGYVTPGYVRVFKITYATAHATAPEVKTVDPTRVDDQYKYELTAADLPTLPDADGYVFKGWCIDSQKVEVGTVISGDVSLTASWDLATVAFTVSWDNTAKISKAYAKVGAAEKSEIQNGAAIQVIPGTVVTLSADFTESWIKCPELRDYTVDAATAVTLTTKKIDPSSDITPDTKAADVGITDGAFKEMTGTELGRVVGWAEAKGFSPSDLNKVAFDADGDATTSEAEAYLLNCSADELEQAKADFKITALTQNDDGSWTVEVNGEQFNGVVEKVPVEDITVTNGELYRAVLRFKPSND